MKAAAPRRAAPAGILLLAAISLFWGLSWPAIKIVVAEMPVLAFRSLCCLVGGLGALLLARITGESIRLPQGAVLPLATMGFFNVTLWQLCMAYGLRILPAGHASIIAYTMPAFATLLGWIFLNERVTAARLGGLALSMAGLAVLVAPELHDYRSAPVGILLMVGASASWAVGTIGMKYFRWSISVLQNTGWQFLLGGIPIVLAALVEGATPAFGTLSLPAWMAFVYVLAVPILFCQWAWFKTVELLPGSISAMGTLAIPIVGALSGALLLGEHLGSTEIVALALVGSGLACVTLEPGSRRR